MVARLLSLSLLVLIAAGLGLGQPGGAGSEAKVKALVEQLGGKEQDAQAAESALLKLGPDILPLLPEPAGKGARDERLRTVRAILKELLPRTATLKGKPVPLSQALKELETQTGMAVVDNRGTRTDPAVTLKGTGLPFWQALDQLATASGARVELYGADGRPALGLGPPKGEPQPISYHGPFRTNVRKLTLARHLDTGLHTCLIQLDLAWEPRFRVLLVETGPASVRFAPDKQGKELQAQVPGQGRSSPATALAVESRLLVPAPHRSAPAIAEVKGHFGVVLANKVLPFTFPLAKGSPQTQEGVSARVSDVVQEKGRWIIEMTIKNPSGAAFLETHQYSLLWRLHHAIWLQKGKQRLLPTLSGTEYEKETATEGVLRYLFTTKGNPGVPFGNLSDWTLHYQAPGRIVELTVPYQFKGVALP